ncbi:interleukin-1 receptor type 1-like isoform X2 [Betta splendens]|uniref:Interleukin-1 receptor type 1-like isoform X2 n=1 Tax=Betta splendens TaxID=158456 RepID=A0A6P7LHL4_BETSP|nr:interleukin-1 receptor type 1-like isoform X2 [Betta splendens]XP_055361159.1 interleukin-1 receptor type 1-like isoform X2 [Betta splendens]
MAVTGWVYLFASIQYLGLLMAHNPSVEMETYHVSAGHMFLLKCLIPGAHPNVTWGRGGRHNLNLPTGVEVREGLLWFLPVQTAHEGNYTCEKWSTKGLLQMTVQVSVSNRECPDASETVSIPHGVSGSLPCKQTEIFQLGNTTNIRWMQECQPVQPLSVDNKGLMRLPAVSETHVGKYTCLVDLSVDGREYTAARSIQLTVNNDMVATEPQVVLPHNQVIKVEVGMPLELICEALIGHSEDVNTVMYWTVNMEFIEEYNGLTESWEFLQVQGRVYSRSVLFIPEVHPHFLNVPIQCHTRNSVGQSVGVVTLHEADRTVLYITVALCLTGPLALLALGAVFFLCKVDLVLAHRKLLRHFPKKQALDGKLYDGYVSFLSPNTQRSAEAATFALRILPEELEKKHGYSLYIRGRDDCPGEAVHDSIAAAIHQCHRLIIILSPEAKNPTDAHTAEETLPTTCDDQTQMCYEQKVGLYSALTQNDPQVILVEIDGPVDYSRLPESLRYIRRKQGALKFRTDSTRAQRLSQLCSNRNFWKSLRYHMPSVPTGRRTIV